MNDAIKTKINSYKNAFVAAFSDKNELEKAVTQLREILTTLEKNNLLCQVVPNPINYNIFDEIADYISQNVESGVLASFISQVAKNRSINLLPEIVFALESHLKHMNNVLDVEVLSSNSLDIETQNKITSIIEKNFIEKKVFVNFIQDRSITNGIIFKIGDQIIDLTIDRQLKTLLNINI
jgi:ATP synthase F1 delta subunit